MLLTINGVREIFDRVKGAVPPDLQDAHMSALAHIDFLTGNFSSMVAAEREACAAIADKAKDWDCVFRDDAEATAKEIAAAIRAACPPEEER